MDGKINRGQRAEATIPSVEGRGEGNAMGVFPLDLVSELAAELLLFGVSQINEVR